MSGERLFDSHLHLTDPRLLDPDAGGLAAVLAAAREAGVGEMVTVGTGPGDSATAAEVAAGADGVWSTAGLHPHDASRFGPEVLARLEDLLGRPEVVAVGETGLDYHYDNSPRGAQRESFRAHLDLAARAGAPVVVHSREADGDTAAAVREAGAEVGGVLHCFTGGDALLEAGLEAGWYVSFSGIVTFDGYDGGDRVRRVPEERILLETDSPYLAPVPRRGRRNEPAFLVHTCERIAEIRGTSVAELVAATRRNAARFYGLPGR